MQKVINYLILIILLSSLTFAVEGMTSTFTNGLSSEQINLGIGNNLRYISIPIYSYIRNITTSINTPNLKLLSRYKLDSNTTYSNNSVVYDSQGTNNGTLNGYTFNHAQRNGTTINSTFGKFGNGASFNGSGDYLNGTSPLNGNQSYTFCAWIKPVGDSSWITDLTREYILSAGNSSYGISDSITYQNPPCIINIYKWPGSAGQISYTISNCANNWNHICETWDNSITNNSLYVNGQIVSNLITGPIAGNFDANFKIGFVSDGTTRFYNGSLDNVAIWNRSLSAGEVNTVYQSGKYLNPNVTDSLIFYMPFENFNSTTVMDENHEDTGVYGEALRTTSGYVNLGNPLSLNLTNNFTISAWVYPRATTAGGIIVKQPNSALSGYSLFEEAGGIAYCGLSNGTTFNAGVSLDLNTWNFLVCEKNATASIIYKNGQYVTSSAFPSAVLDNNNNVYMGQMDSGNLIFNGSIDEVQIFNTSLSAQQINYLYQNTVDNYYPNLTYNLSSQNQYANQSFVGNVNISLNTSYANNIISSGCACNGCVLSGSNCYLPINLFSLNGGYILAHTLLNASYAYAIDNCSGGFNLPSNSTFSILTKDQATSNTLVTNGSFNIYYNGNYYYSLASNKSNFTFCSYPAWYNLSGNILSTLISSGYQNLLFNQYNVPFNQNFNAYLLTTSATSNYITYTIQDSATTTLKLQNALMSCNTTIAGISTPVLQGLSDIEGNILFYQDQTALYTCTVNASGYPIKPFALTPTLTTYLVSMNAGTATVQFNTYSGIIYKRTPTSNLFPISNGYQPITFELQGNDLDYFGMTITGISNCSPSCTQKDYSPTGGIITTNIVVNTSQRFYVSLFFKVSGQNEVTINSYPYDSVVYLNATQSALTNVLSNIRQNTSPNVRTIAAAFISVVIVGIASSTGVLGVGMLFVLLITNIALALPEVGLVSPFYGIFSSVIIIVFIIYYSRYSS